MTSKKSPRGKSGSGGKRPPEPPPASKEDYKVGRGRPPQHTRYKKGQSGNPGGRPKGSRNLRSLIYKYAEEEIHMSTAQGSMKVSAREAAGRKFWEAMLKKGDLRFFKEYFGIEVEMEAELAKIEEHRNNPLHQIQRKWNLILSGKVEGMSDEEIEEYANRLPDEEW